MQIREFKVSLIGEKQIGKTCFFNRLDNSNSNSDYIPTIGVNVKPLDLFGSNGKIRINIWDNAGDNRFRGLKDNYHINSNLAIIFRNNNNNHLIFENELPDNIKKLYIDNYNINQPEFAVNEYKDIIYNILVNN